MPLREFIELTDGTIFLVDGAKNIGFLDSADITNYLDRTVDKFNIAEYFIVVYLKWWEV